MLTYRRLLLSVCLGALVLGACSGDDEVKADGAGAYRAAAAPPSAAPHPLMTVGPPGEFLGPMDDGPFIGLAGDAAIIASSPLSDSNTVQVRRVPLDGSRPSLLLKARADGEQIVTGQVASSAQVVAVYIRGNERYRLVAGPPTGPLTESAPYEELADGMEFESTRWYADGAQLFLRQIGQDIKTWRHTVRELGVQPRPLTLAKDADHVAFTGDLVAYATARPGDTAHNLRRVVVENWRTGVKRSEARVRSTIEDLDLGLDGTVLLAQRNGAITALRPNRPARRLTRSGTQPRFAGDRIVYVTPAQNEDEADDDGLIRRITMIEPSGQAHRFGFPSNKIEQLQADDRHLLWRANGCVVVADVTAAATKGPAPGPCRRSEVLVKDDRRVRRIGRDLTISVPVRCVAAPPEGCRGTVTLEPRERGAAVPVAFHIPAGATRSVHARLTRSGLASLRKENDDRRSALVEAIARTLDGGGGQFDAASGVVSAELP